MGRWGFLWWKRRYGLCSYRSKIERALLVVLFKIHTKFVLFVRGAGQGRAGQVMAHTEKGRRGLPARGKTRGVSRKFLKIVPYVTGFGLWRDEARLNHGYKNIFSVFFVPKFCLFWIG